MDPSTKRWRLLDTLAPFLALAGLAGSLVPDYLRVRTWDVPATDFKTLFAAVRLFAQGQNPYSTSLLQNVFQADKVIEPSTWFAHMPVYPPFTLAVLRPIAMLNMATAAWLWFILSAILMACALGTMLRWSRDELGLPFVWRMVLLAVCVACPLVAYALEVGNVSTAVAALSMLAYFLRDKPVVRGALLALALLLKPHLALWLLIAMLASSIQTTRAAALWSAGFSMVFVVLTSAWQMLQGSFRAVWQSYSTVMSAESVASMSAQSHELLPLEAQITSVWSLVQYVSTSVVATVCAGLLIALCAGTIAWSLWRSRRHCNPALRLTAVAACVAFGMIVTYHRAHDGQLLLIALPVLFAGLWRGLRLLSAVLLLLLAGTWFTLPGQFPFLEFRQASIASLLFVLVLSFFAVIWAKKAKKGRYER